MKERRRITGMMLKWVRKDWTNAPVVVLTPERRANSSSILAGGKEEI